MEFFSVHIFNHCLNKNKSIRAGLFQSSRAVIESYARRTNSVNAETRLRIASQRDRLSISGRVQRFSSTPKGPDLLWGLGQCPAYLEPVDSYTVVEWKVREPELPPSRLSGTKMSLLLPLCLCIFNILTLAHWGHLWRPVQTQRRTHA
jgi:hypothetical protein